METNTRTWKKPFSSNKHILNMLWRCLVLVTSPVCFSVGLVGAIVLLILGYVVGFFWALINFVKYGEFSSPLWEDM